MQELDSLKSRLRQLQSELERVSVYVEGLKVLVNGTFSANLVVSTASCTVRTFWFK